MWFPPPPPPKGGPSLSKAILVTLATSVFGLSLMLNVYLLILAGFTGGESGKTKTISAGDPNQKVAVVPVDGIIMGREAEQFDKLMDRVEREPGVKALVIEVDTPGGDVSASDEMYQRVEKFKADHSDVKVTIAMKGMATSGGYYLSCAGDYIFAEPTTLTANIGVLMPRYNLSQLADKWGVRDATLKSQGSPFKDAGSMLKPENPRDTAYMQDLIDQMYTQFKGVVQKGRQTQLAAKKQTVDAIADGRAMTAKEALSKGIIDQIGYPSDAYQYAATQAGLKNPTVVKYEERPSLMDLFVGQSSSSFGGARTTVNGVNVNVDRQLVGELLRPHVMYLWTGQ
jgi:protease-4